MLWEYIILAIVLIAAVYYAVRTFHRTATGKHDCHDSCSSCTGCTVSNCPEKKLTESEQAEEE